MSVNFFDIITIGDFRHPLGRSSTLAEQLKAAALFGYRVGLVQIESLLVEHPAAVDDDISALIKNDLAALLDPDQPASAKLLIAADPVLFTHLPRRVLQLEADVRLVMVRESPINAWGDEVYDWPGISRHAAEVLGGPVIFAPLHQGARAQLRNLDPSPVMTAEDWEDSLDPQRFQQQRDSFRGSRPVLGRHGQERAKAWPDDPAVLLAAYPDDRSLVVRLLGGSHALKGVLGPIPRNWEVLASDSVGVSGFLSTLDFFVFTHHPSRVDPVEPPILEAMASGVVTILPLSFEPIFGGAAVYAAPERIEEAVRHLYADWTAYARQSQRGVQAIASRFSPARHLDRLRDLIGPPGAEGKTGTTVDSRPVPTPTRRKRRVLFITINGVGMGHLTRMLAIARRCAEPIEPVFLTMSQGLKVLREQGFLAEYVPSRTYLNCDNTRWNDFLCEEVEELITFYDPAVVLFDGNVPYQGIIDAIKAHPDPWYVWSRRGMWRGGSASILERESFFDAVLEPGDLADDYDKGITTRYRNRTRRVLPIRLLDQADMLPRDEAKRELGLKPGKPAVLIQLGAGNNFDYRDIHKTAITHLTSAHQADIAVGEWLITEQPIDLPDGVVRLPGYPFARYFNAFDIAISAVGYNSFHELLYAGLPTILIPNESMKQDNQLARAMYADRHGLAACVRSKEIYSLTSRIDQLLDPAVRGRMQGRLNTLKPENGAAEAAAFIEEMAYSRRIDRG